MSSHAHHKCECPHTQLKYCDTCHVVYCKSCSEEWGHKPVSPWMLYRAQMPYPSTTTIGYNNTHTHGGSE